ncbi:MAG TPA: dTMP kinase [Acidimicrobiia bacterium]|nr:dTMP kinase [Acidimicrobiia bacterium]
MTFIVLEGGEGSGKSTQARALADALRAEGRDVVVTFEPGDTPAGVRIREILLHADAPIDSHAELLLMLADRAQHVAQVVAPALARGAIVVCDRFSPSSLAYQGIARKLGVGVVESLDAFARNGCSPDLVVVLDVPDDVAESRVAVERDRFERAGEEFHARVRAAYRELAGERGWVLVDGTGPVDDVAARVRAAAASFLS